MFQTMYNDECDAITTDHDAVGYLSADGGRLPDLPAVRPPVGGIRVPRSAKRAYTDGELRAAAGMMDRLRHRDDQRPLAAAAAGPASDPLDVAVDRLLRVL